MASVYEQKCGKIVSYHSRTSGLPETMRVGFRLKGCSHDAITTAIFITTIEFCRKWVL